MKSLVLFCTETVLHAVKTLQVGAGLCAGDDVVGRDHIFCCLHGEKFYHCTHLGKAFQCIHKCLFYLRVQAFGKIFLGHTEFHSHDLICHGRGEIKILSLHGSAVLCIVSGNDLKKCRTVRNVFSNRSNLVQRGCIGNQSVTRYGTVGWLDSGNTTVGTWLTDRTAGIRTKCQVSFPCCHCRTGTTGRSSRNVFQIPRVSGHAIGRSLCSTSHGKLIHICFSDNYKSCFFQTVNDFCIVLWNEVFKDL